MLQFFVDRCFVSGMSIVRDMKTCENFTLSATHEGGNHSDSHVSGTLSSTNSLVYHQGALGNMSVPINCSSSNEAVIPVDSVVEFWE